MEKARDANHLLREMLHGNIPSAEGELFEDFEAIRCHLLALCLHAELLPAVRHSEKAGKASVAVQGVATEDGRTAPQSDSHSQKLI